MMRRPWQTWLAFALCMAAAVAGMAWLSVRALDLERGEKEAQGSAAVEECARLALWRMESSLAGFLGRESMHPYFEYAPFHPVEGAYARMFGEPEGGGALMPSRLLASPDPYVRLHFQVDEEGRITSPQVPEGTLRALAEKAALPATQLDASAALLGELRSRIGRDELLRRLPEAAASLPAITPEKEEEAPPIVPSKKTQSLASRNSQVAQAEINEQEYRMRGKSIENAAAQQAESIPENWAQDALEKNSLADAKGTGAEGPETAGEGAVREDRHRAERQGAAKEASPLREEAPAEVRLGPLQALWIRDALLLARRVEVGAATYIQGAWLDWPAIRSRLLGDIRDLFPQADLIPVREGEEAESARRLAALPLRLEPGSATAFAALDGFGPIRVALLIAWACLALAGAAVASLLRGALLLSERRGAFVSAVTHELRTPLTTLRLYTDLLAEGMVPSQERRAQYLDVMRVEAERLAHLVENVLAYSRLERRGLEALRQEISVEALLARAQDRLARHAERASMRLDLQVAEGCGARKVRVDPAAVEQILFNLVDNACKYAREAENRTLVLSAAAARDGGVIVRLEDRGPGVPAGEASRLFQPFRKSARDAAGGAPGVGLGLALSRRLAREMGGDLLLVKPSLDAKGACFALVLPCGRKEDGQGLE